MYVTTIITKQMHIFLFASCRQYYTAVFFVLTTMAEKDKNLKKKRFFSVQTIKESGNMRLLTEKEQDEGVKKMTNN
jgi:hypothetical protein